MRTKKLGLKIGLRSGRKWGRKRRPILWLAGCALFVGGSAASWAAEPKPSEYLIAETEELRMAATAGPRAITDGASYWILRSNGYVQVKEGANGFHCFVERSWSGPSPSNTRLFDPRVRAPHCINPEGAQTTMREMFFVAELAMAERSPEEIEREVDEAYAEGRLTLPTELSLTYMMSKHQWLGERIGAWQPHVMLWVPYLTEEKVGAIAALGTPNAMLGGQPGSRRSVLIFPVPEFLE